MNRVIFTLILLVGLSGMAVAGTTSDLQTICNHYAMAPASADFSNDTTSVACFMYVRGVAEEMAGEIVISPDNKYVVGLWADGVSNDQVIRVFIKYVAANPETLNKPAFFIVRYAAVAAGLYSYTPYKAPIVPSNN